MFSSLSASMGPGCRGVEKVMATTCTVGFDVEKIGQLIRADYDRVSGGTSGKLSLSIPALKGAHDQQSSSCSR